MTFSYGHLSVSELLLQNSSTLNDDFRRMCAPYGSQSKINVPLAGRAGNPVELREIEKDGITHSGRQPGPVGGCPPSGIGIGISDYNVELATRRVSKTRSTAAGTEDRKHHRNCWTRL